MNNRDLRGVIWSFLRKKPKARCYNCDKVCVWDKKLLYMYYTENHNNGKRVVCLSCWWTRLSNMCSIS